MDMHVVATTGSGVLQAIGTTLSTLKNARDLAKESKNHELKEVISDAFDALLDLKERILTLDEENRELKEKLVQKKRLTAPESPYGYVYRIDDTAKEHPLCPACFLKNGAEHYLDVAPWDDGYERSCRVCNWDCIEPRKHANR